MIFSTWERSSSSLLLRSVTSMNRLSGLCTFEKAFSIVSAMLSKKPEVLGLVAVSLRSPVLLLFGRSRICAFQSLVSRKSINMVARRRTGWRVRRFMNR